jgi:AcrR family transcriptional regulator
MPERVAGSTAERRRRRDDRQRHLLRIAALAFAQRGLHDVSMDDIARAAEVSKPVLYEHFDSKEHLYEATVLDATEELAASLHQAAGAQPDPEQQMWQGIQAFLDAVEQHPEWWLLTRQAAQISEGRLADLGRRSHQISTNAITNLFSAAGDSAGTSTMRSTLELLAQAFVGACATVAQWWIVHPEIPKETVAVTLMNMLWMGFGDLSERNLWLPPADEADPQGQPAPPTAPRRQETS